MYPPSFSPTPTVPEPFSPQTAHKTSRLRGAPSPRASVPTAPSAAANSSTPRPASSSTSRATPKAPSTRARSAPRAPTPSSSPSIRTASRTFSTAPRSPTTGSENRWTGRRPIAERVKEARAPTSLCATRKADCSTRCHLRHAGQGHHGQRGKLPHQEAVRWWSGSGVH